ncbi:YicC/YloC family endoribonuclease [Alkalilacustris brevis]|uniref:YicC/YloC family endoribonuclease n=1 Tax=Alkalilacustris brevis TaxID=2026338 RepID=UPI000E0E067B|nr:YicC/YloC family endoribonuclease [Alkalilacustris brevis]
MVNSMTGYATLRGAGEGAEWVWEMRGVNGRGLDLRLRLPDGVEGLEPLVRAELSRRLRRGSVSLSLRLSHGTGGAALRVDAAALEAALAALRQAEAAAARLGLALAPATGAAVLGIRGVLDSSANAAPDAEALRAALMADLPALLDAFLEMRAEEGRRLAALLTGHLDTVEALTAQAAERAEARRPAMAVALREALAAVMEAAPTADSGRVEQELALLAVKTDVTEEIDRLRAHVAAARDLLVAGQGGAPVGRKLDFLMQEFNREANTLCSKAQDSVLTRLGLDLKAVIDQMREQVQNVE